MYDTNNIYMYLIIHIFVYNMYDINKIYTYLNIHIYHIYINIGLCMEAYWMFSHLSVISQLILHRMPKQVLHPEVWKRVVARGSHSCVGCKGLTSSTCTFMAKAAQLLGRFLDCLDICHSDKINIIIGIFSGTIVTNFYL